MMRRVLYALFIFVPVISCSDEAQGPDDSVNGEPAVTEIGVAIGDAVTAEIGAAGGSLFSQDGKLAITVPPGAVNTNTTFSVQPIISFCPGEMSAFRLLPEGLTFSAPVNLTFHFTEEEIEGTLPEFLGIAYQAADKIWYRLPGATVDVSAKTITVPVKHFTDWAILEQLRIEPREPAIPEVRVGETLELHLDGAEDLAPLTNNASSNAPDNPSPGEDYLPPLPDRIPFQARWSVNGDLDGNATIGTISRAGDVAVIYKAPASVPANNQVQISAELTRFRFWDHVNGRMSSFNDVILFKRVLIKPDEYNFSLELQLKTNLACGLAGQQYTDRMEMDIKVKQNLVTVSNIQNYPAAISPTELAIPDTDCTITCIPGPTGLVNVTQVGGTVSPGLKGQPTLYLQIYSKGATSNDQTMQCPDTDPVVAPHTTLESSFPVEFLLKDSTQVKDQGVNGYWVKLTPM